MALVETRDVASRGKRSFGLAFTQTELTEGLTTSPKKFSPKTASPSVLAGTDDAGDDAALLLVAFANHKAPSGPQTPTEAVPDAPSVPEAQFSNTISDDPARSDSSSETTTLSTSRMQDSSSDGEEYSVEYDSDDGLPSSPKGLGDDDTTFGLHRRRAGQHFNKRRHRTSAEQLRVLEMTYAGNKVPNQELRKDLASQLGMTTRRVQIWFQNKRAKEKRLKNSLQSKVLAGAAPPQLPHLSSSLHLAHPHLPSPLSSSLPDRSSYSPLAATAAPHSPSYSTPARNFSPLAPPTLSGLLAQPNLSHDPSRMSVAWMSTPQALYYPHMIPTIPQLPTLPPSQASHQPILYPNMWNLSPLR